MADTDHLEPQVLAELERMRADGFRGQPDRAPEEIVEDGGHVLRVRLYTFPPDERARFVEAFETHDRRGRARILPVSAAVHVLQNVTDEERWQIENRELDLIDNVGHEEEVAIVRDELLFTVRGSLNLMRSVRASSAARAVGLDGANHERRACFALVLALLLGDA